MKNILFIDLTLFYGGGQKFISNIFSSTLNAENYHFIVSNEKLYNDLGTANKLLVTSNEGYSGLIKLINKYIAKNDISTVLLNGNRPIYFAPFIRANHIIAYRHTSNNAFSGLKKYIGGIVLNIAFLWCDKVVLLYNKAIEEIWQKRKVVVINNGILFDDKGLHQTAGDNEHLTICCISRLDPDKGISWLIDQFSAAFATNPNVILKIAGDGNMRSFLEEKIEKLPVKIELLGFVTDVHNLLLSSDLFILPSKYESFPLSILEAMGHSLPVIATDTGGVSEMVKNGENGFVIPFDDNEILKEKMLYIINNKAERLLMGANSYRLMSNFSIDKCVSRLEELVK